MPLSSDHQDTKMGSHPTLSKLKSIPVIFCINAAYLPPVYVAISSILRHTDPDIPRPIEFYILMSKVPENVKDTIPLLFSTLGAEITFIEAPIPQVKNATTHAHCSDDAYLLYLIPQLFADNYEKAIYLDADTLAQGNIFSMFDYMEEKDGLIAVHDHDAHGQELRQYFSPLPVPNSTYFNSGVIGFNFKNLPDNFSDKCLYHTNPAYPLGDQDAFNALVIGENINISILPNDYNAWPDHHDSGIIFHYIGTGKPWRDPNREKANLWLDEKEFLLKKLARKEIISLLVFSNLLLVDTKLKRKRS